MVHRMYLGLNRTAVLLLRSFSIYNQNLLCCVGRVQVGGRLDYFGISSRVELEL